MKQRIWWVLVPTIVTAVATATLSYFFMPTRYQSEAVLVVMPPRVPQDFVRSSIDSRLSARLQVMSQQILSHTRLERLIRDLNLYPSERPAKPMDALTRRMRDDISLTIDTRDVGEDHEGAFRVAFRSADPQTAMRVTERLASLMVEENLRDREVLAEGTNQFLDSQIADVRRQILDKEAQLARLRANTRGELSQADLLPYEVLKDTYKALLVKQQDAMIAANLERRQIGEQLKVVNAARLPDAPVGPSRAAVDIGGALAGLGFGLVVMGVSKRQKK